jgi:hypothetical protein
VTDQFWLAATNERRTLRPVSTLELQLQVLRKAGCQKIFREKVSGVGREAARRRGIHFGRLRKLNYEQA